MSTTDKKLVAPEPSIKDYVSHFFTGKPVLPTGAHVLIATLRTVLILIVSYAISYATDLSDRQLSLTTLTNWQYFLPGVLYLIVGFMARVARANNSPFGVMLQMFSTYEVKYTKQRPDIDELLGQEPPPTPPHE